MIHFSPHTSLAITVSRLSACTLPSPWRLDVNFGDTTWFKQSTQVLYAAVAPGDKAIWRRTLSRDCINTDEDGRVYDRTASLRALNPLPNGFSGSIRIRCVAALTCGPTASVHYWIDQREGVFGQELHITYVETDTCRREGAGGRWSRPRLLSCRRI